MPPRSRRTQSEWKVQTVISPAAFLETMPPMRSRISEAALLVKVTARICVGRDLFFQHVGDPAGDGAGLAGARAGEDHDGAVQRGHGLALGLVQGVEGKRGCHRRAESSGAAAGWRERS